MTLHRRLNIPSCLTVVLEFQTSSVSIKVTVPQLCVMFTYMVLDNLPFVYTIYANPNECCPSDNEVRHIRTYFMTTNVVFLLFK